MLQRSDRGGVQHLVVTGYDFSSIPNGVTVLGIALAITKSVLGPGTATDARVSLVDASGSFTAENQARPDAWPASGEISSGGVTDTWGRPWTGAEVKFANFGWVIVADTTRDDGAFTDFYAFVNCGRIEICYSPHPQRCGPSHARRWRRNATASRRSWSGMRGAIRVPGSPATMNSGPASFFSGRRACFDRGALPLCAWEATT